MTTGLAGGLLQADKAPIPATLTRSKHCLSHRFLRYHESDNLPLLPFSCTFLWLHHPGFFVKTYMENGVSTHSYKLSGPPARSGGFF